ncbi:MAG: T9SS type A sorting domain-containing protein, partial [Ignavibacteriaceae bacterium]
DGEHLLRVFGKTILGNMEDNAGYERLFTVSNEMDILNVYNYPNPFTERTDFTFRLTQIPDELKIKIYTIAGRLIREIIKPQAELRFDFNTIAWDGKDEDGDQIANGVYLYKIIMKKGGETKDVIQKLARLR